MMEYCVNCGHYANQHKGTDKPEIEDGGRCLYFGCKCKKFIAYKPKRLSKQ